MKAQSEGKRLFNGREFLAGHDLVLEGAQIGTLVPNDGRQSSDTILLPGLIDLQIYGAAGRLFSADPTVETLLHMEEHLIKTGTTSFLACVATNTPEVTRQCIEAAKAHRPMAKNCLGLHLEGPFLNVKRSGAHVKEYIRTASLDEVKALLELGDGVIKMMTIAPELHDEQVLQYLLDQGVLLSLGHSDASFEQAKAAYDLGIQTTTHLFNAMTPILHREPGIPTAVFNHPRAFSSIIADGHHVDFNVVQFAHKLMGSRLFLITDAVASCNIGPYQHRLEGDKFVMPDGTLSGANSTLLQSIENCVVHAGIGLEAAMRMATSTPAELLGDAYKIGSLAEGYWANMIEIDANFKLKQVWFKGEAV